MMKYRRVDAEPLDLLLCFQARELAVDRAMAARWDERRKRLDVTRLDDWSRVVLWAAWWATGEKC